MSRQKATRKEKFSNAPLTKVTGTKEKFVNDNTKRNLGWIVAVLAFIVYANTIGHSYVLDDYSAILENKSTLKGFSGIPEIFKTSFRYGYIFVADELYRPLAKSVLAIEWGLAPDNPSFAHLLNVILFVFTGWILFDSLTKWIKGNLFVPFAATILFITLPIHTEVVANIKSVDEILSFLFGLMMLRSVYNYNSKENPISLLKAFFWFLAAMFSKESSITFLAVIPLSGYFFSDKPLKKSVIPTAVCFASALLFLAIRYKAIGPVGVSIHPATVDNMLMAAPDFFSRLATAIYLLGLYLQTIIFPINLTFDNSYPQLTLAGLTDWRFILSAIIFTAMLIIAVAGWKRKELYSFAILFFFITVSVSSNIFVIIGTHYGERLMYMPSFGICLLFSVLLYRYIPGSADIKSFFIENRTGLTILVIGGIIYSTVSIARNAVWKNNESLYRSGLISAPNSTRVQYYLGNFLIKEEQLAGKTAQQQDSILNSGIGYLKNAVKLTPSFTDAWNQMGIAYARKKNSQEAIKCYKEGLKYNAVDPTVHNNLGTVYFADKNFNEALTEFNEAVRLNPRYAEAWINIGSTYGSGQQFDNAISAFEKALAVDPSNAMADYYLGITWRSKGNEALAQNYLNQAYALNPSLRK